MVQNTTTGQTAWTINRILLKLISGPISNRIHWSTQDESTKRSSQHTGSIVTTRRHSTWLWKSPRCTWQGHQAIAILQGDLCSTGKACWIWLGLTQVESPEHEGQGKDGNLSQAAEWLVMGNGLKEKRLKNRVLTYGPLQCKEELALSTLSDAKELDIHTL